MIRTEYWTRIADDGSQRDVAVPVRTSASVSGEVVVVSYEQWSRIMEILGFLKMEEKVP